MGKKYKYDWDTVEIMTVAQRLNLPLLKKQGQQYITYCLNCEKGKTQGSGHLYIHPGKNQFACPKCGYKGNAWVLARDSVGIERGKQIMNGACLSSSTPRVSRPKAPPEPEVLNVAERNAVYTQFLRKLVLSPSDRENLRNRGFRDEDIERVGYKTLPSRDSLKGIAYLLAKEGYPLEGIPGFYKDRDGRWASMWLPGFLCPFKDEQGRIQGFQIRVDDKFIDYSKSKNPDSNLRKYMWFSSADKPGGCSSGAPVHFAYNPGERPKVINITEGHPKAELARMFTGEPYIAVAGTSQYQRAVNAAAKLGVEKANVVYDADRKTNPYVRQNVVDLIKALEKKKIQPVLYDWDLSLGKGIDDLLLRISQGQIPLDKDIIESVLKIDKLKDDEVVIEITTVKIRGYWNKIKNLIKN